MTKLYEMYGIPEKMSLEFDDPPSYAVVKCLDDESYGQDRLHPYHQQLWGQCEYWTPLEAALLVCEIAPDGEDLYEVIQETVEDQGFGTKYFLWKHEYQFAIAKEVLFLFERSRLAPKSAPSEWIKYYRQLRLNDPKFGDTRYGEVCWFDYYRVALENNDSPEIPGADDRSYVSDDLQYLKQASTKFWAKVDRDSPGTHPDNDTVAKWLVEKGYSPTTANIAASIIRPAWAAKGRKPRNE